jgi:NAD(P)H-hydrate epimerase
LGYSEELERCCGGPAFVSAAQGREIDRRAGEELGLPGLVLMENAGMHATDVAIDMLSAADASVVIFCGAGNNGGDGYVIARQLHLRGVQVMIRCSVEIEKLTGDALVQARVVRNIGIEVLPLLESDRTWAGCDLAIDALLGTGMTGPLRPDLARALEGINQTCQASGMGTLAIDLPSGMNADTGEAAGQTFRAQRTVTFAALKEGFAHPEASRFTGAVYVAPIGVPAEFVAKVLRGEGTLDPPGDV